MAQSLSVSPRPATLAAVALGVSTIVFLDCVALLTSPTHDAVYHLPGAASALFIPALANILALAALCFLALLATRRHARLDILLWSAILCFLPWIILKNVSVVLGKTVPHRVSASCFALCCLAFLVFAFSSSPVIHRAFETLRGLASAVLASLGILGIATLLLMTRFGLQARHLNDTSLAALPTPASNRHHGRVLWIVLDELAYRQLYDERLPGLSLPAFDQLRSESTIFTNVQPAGIQTEIILPSLMNGQPVDHIRSSPAGSLFLHNQSGWQPFRQHNTVFSDADALGYRSAVVGWYNPYCRILSAVLSSCFWTGPQQVDDLFPSDHLGSNLFHPLLHLLLKVPHFLHATGPSPDELADGNAHIHEFLALDHAADAALSDPRNNLLLIHMPIPHPSGIWNRRTQQFAVDHSSYVDNLALADLYLAHVRHLLEASHQWDDTTLLIMGDHAWRTQLIWLKTPAWSAEDERASNGGQFDPRPAYILKLPHQHTPLEISTSFPAVRTRALLDALLAEQITGPTQLQEWVDHVPLRMLQAAIPARPAAASRTRIHP
jgi:hypothetical protein